MMDKNRFGLVLFISFFLLSVSVFAQSGCCVDPDAGICDSSYLEANCEGDFYENLLCDEVELMPCEEVCNLCSDGTITIRLWEKRIIGCSNELGTVKVGENDDAIEGECTGAETGITSEDDMPIISGTVRQAGTGVPGAIVTCGSKTTTTSNVAGHYGEYSMTCGTFGNNIAVIAQKDSLSGQVVLSLAKNADVSPVDIDLLGATTTLLKVTVMKGDEFVSGATVLVTGKEGYSREDTTGTNGIAEFADAPRDSTVFITASKEGLSTPKSVNLLDAEEEVTIYLFAGESMTISGYVLNGSTTPKEKISGAKVDVLLSAATSVLATTNSDADGFYSLTVPKGTYDIRVTKEKFSVFSSPIPAENYNKFNISLNPSVFAGVQALFKIQAVDSATKDGIHNVEVAFIKNNQIVTAAYTAVDGTKSISLPLGQYNLRLRHDNYEEKYTQYTISQDMADYLTVELTFIPNITISGQVTDTTGNALSEAAVSIDGKTYYTNIFGYFDFERKVSRYEGTLVASAVGYASKFEKIPANRETDINFDIELAEQRCSSLAELGNLVLSLDDLDRTEATFEWDSDCSADTFRIYRRDSVETKLMDILPGSTTNYFDDTLKSGETYYFWVEGDYSFGFGTTRTLVSNEVEVSIGPEICFDGDKKFCQGGDKWECKDGIIVAGTPACTGDEICMETVGGTTCVIPRQCDLCNRPFGVFSYPQGSTLFGAKGFFEVLFEYDSNTAFSCTSSNVPCYRDSSNTVVDKNYECGQIESCYDYISKDSCQLNKCLKSQVCEWADSAYSELGIGVCRPQKIANQKCEAFNEGKRVNNAVFASDSGIAASTVCSLYKSDENCIYSEFRKECIDKEDISCVDYSADIDKCLGEGGDAQEIDINVNWNRDEIISGDNKIIALSKDLFSVGICQYMDEIEDVFSGGCMRNADDSPAILKEEGLDCSLEDEECLSDNSPPETFMFFKDKAKEIDFDYDVKDEYGKDIVSTFYSVFTAEQDNAGEPAMSYPSTEPVDGKIIHYTNDEDEGTYWLYYFSQDPAKNLEEIRRFPVEIDRTSPEINLNFIMEPDLINKDVALTVNFNLPPLREDSLPNDDLAYCINDSETGLWKELTIGTSKTWQSLNDKLSASTLDGSLANSFTETYADVETGEGGSGIQVQYRWKCYDAAGNPAENFGYCEDGICKYDFILDADSTFSEPTRITVKERADVPISIKTMSPGVCKFSDKNDGDYEKWTLFEFTGENAAETATGFMHSGAYTVGSGIENQQIYVACIFEGLEGYIQGLEEDQISITIDDKRPSTLIKDVATDETIPTTLSTDFWIGGSNGNHIKLVCKDAEQGHGQFIPNEIGCDSIFYCSVPKGSAEECIFEEKEASYTPDVDESMNVKYYSVDKLDNTETPEKTATFNLDKEKPVLSLAAPFNNNFETKSETVLLTFTITNEENPDCTSGCEVSPLERYGTYYKVSSGEKQWNATITIGDIYDSPITRSSIPVQLETNKVNTFLLRTEDQAGNFETKSIEITQDSLGPNLTLASIRQSDYSGMEVEYGNNMQIVVEGLSDVHPKGSSHSRVSEVWAEDMFGAKYVMQKISGEWRGIITTESWPVTAPEFPTYLTIYAKDILGNTENRKVDFVIKDNSPPWALISLENNYGEEKSTLTKGENFVVMRASESLRNITLYFEASNGTGTKQFPVMLIARDYNALTWVGVAAIDEGYFGDTLLKGDMYDINNNPSYDFRPDSVLVNSVDTAVPSPQGSVPQEGALYVTSLYPTILYEGMNTEKEYQITVNGRIYKVKGKETSTLLQTPSFDSGRNDIIIRTEDSEGNYETVTQVVYAEVETEAKTDTTPPELKDYLFVGAGISNISDKLIANVSAISLTGSRGNADDVYVVGADRKKYNSVLSDADYNIGQIKLIGNTFTETENVLRLIFEDSAGNRAEQQITIIKDLRPPHLISLNFTRRI